MQTVKCCRKNNNNNKNRKMKRSGSKRAEAFAVWVHVCLHFLFFSSLFSGLHFQTQLKATRSLRRWQILGASERELDLGEGQRQRAQVFAESRTRPQCPPLQTRSSLPASSSAREICKFSLLRWFTCALARIRVTVPMII